MIEILWGRANFNALIQRIKDRDIVVLMDNNSHQFCFEYFRNQLPGLVKVFIVPEGEQSKNLTSFQNITRFLNEHQTHKNSLILNIGGGMITDLGAFVASLYKRGIDFAHVPTTLLSMVDAAHGGKYALDFDDIKNCIGGFAHPSFIYIDELFLATLDSRHIVAGFSEMIKHGLIYDASHFDALMKYQAYRFKKIPTLEDIKRSVEIKNEIVALDPFDKSFRKILNFGHSVGHAIESLSLINNWDWLHGETVAMGICVEAQISLQRNLISRETYLTIIQGLQWIVPVLVKKILQHKEQFYLFLAQDKKNDSELFTMILIKTIGKVQIYDDIKKEEVEIALFESIQDLAQI